MDVIPPQYCNMRNGTFDTFFPSRMKCVYSSHPARVQCTTVIVGVQGKLGFVCGPQCLGKARWYARCPGLCGSVKRMAPLGQQASLGALGSWFSLPTKTEWGSSSWFSQNYSHPFILSQHKIETKFNKLFCYNTGGGALLRHQPRSLCPSLLTKGAPGPSDAGAAATSRSLLLLPPKF